MEEFFICMLNLFIRVDFSINSHQIFVNFMYIYNSKLKHYETKSINCR